MELKRIGIEQKEAIKKLFGSVFTIEPWNDDWSDEKQLDCYIDELCIRTDRRNQWEAYVKKSFIEMKLFQVKPDRLEQFEKMIEGMSTNQLECEGYKILF